MKNRDYELIQALKKKILLSLNSHTRLSLTDISLMSGFSVKHTQSLFFIQCGFTIGKYIKQCIFSKAAILLVLTRKSILDISLDAGYSSQQSFSRAFKKEFLLSPMKYRKRGFIDTKKIISEFKAGDKFIYDGELYLPSIKIKSTFLRFTESVLTPGSMTTKNKRLHKINSILSRTDRVIIISSIKPIKDESSKINIDSFFCSSIETGGEISTIGGTYYKIIFNGSLNDYINIGRDIIFYINTPFPLEVMEEIKKNDNEFDISILIPKENRGNCSGQVILATVLQ
ncbi:helix-turn-helix transcriptional regulator [Escherichia coli]|uniref:helix-turn-helix domain-containing protein n=1 Tax=Escherichia coli TaxID=562 RepID=UPI0018AFF444|nr:AraC family transcriptional regulator [Escherichia coli]EIN2713790.1 helix-turn-helix transcriptional regulator [Escherichia coli]MBF9175511.1 helix-turn-helix transcriptional regulator [Escherichia coli]